MRAVPVFSSTPCLLVNPVPLGLDYPRNCFIGRMVRGVHNNRSITLDSEIVIFVLLEDLLTE